MHQSIVASYYINISTDVVDSISKQKRTFSSISMWTSLQLDNLYLIFVVLDFSSQ